MNKSIRVLFSLITIFTVSLLASETVPSLYDLQSKWRDVNNNEVPVSVGKDSLVIIGMVFTSCAYACPLTISKVQQIEKEMTKAGIKDLKLVLASFDVKNDRPEKLKTYQESKKLDPKKWIFLAAESDADARELAVALGISYKELGDGDFSHSNVITLLDKNGSPIASIDNLNASPDILVAAAKKAKAKK